MKKIKNLSEGCFLKLFFAFVSACFLIAAVCMPDRANMFTGLWNILSQPSKISANYFAMGGYAATFLNMGLVCLISLLLFVVFKGTPNNVSTLAVLLTTGFGSWGINVLNIWPTIFGVMVYALVKKEKMGGLVNAMLFSTGIAPLITDLLIRYPNAEVIGFNWVGLGLAMFVGLIIGFFLPAGLAHSPKVHKGFDLYSAALPIGMTAFFLNATLFKTMGVSLPKALSDIAPETMKVADPMIANIFCIVLFGSCIVAAFLLGCRPKDYWQLLSDPALVTNFSSTYGNATFLMNAGVFGLFILAYFNIVGAEFNGIVFGSVFCMLSTCNSGSHPLNAIPIIMGYAFAEFFFQTMTPFSGGEVTHLLRSQSLIVGICYANGLSPIAHEYGWRYGILVSAMHFCMVTTTPQLHGGMCLYNGGFTTGLVCLLMMPTLERIVDPKLERRALRKQAKQN